MSPRTVLRATRQIPNALTILRFLAIPVFVVLLLQEREGPSWWAWGAFAIAGATDQLDGYLARRWQVESQFGKVADPLADRLMISTAVVLLVALGRLPWLALLLLLRDVVLVAGYRFVVARGYDFQVSRLGKIATWGLYASLGLVLITEKGTWWALACFWINLALAVVAAAQYVVRARAAYFPH
jgi:CDP-diacylglycerol--glycerol-3-phosphate 3-phosphatidyltransferase